MANNTTYEIHFRGYPIKNYDPYDDGNRGYKIEKAFPSVQELKTFLENVHRTYQVHDEIKIYKVNRKQIQYKNLK